MDRDVAVEEDGAVGGRVAVFGLCGDPYLWVEGWVDCCREVDVGSTMVVWVEGSCRDAVWAVGTVAGADEPQLVKFAFRQYW